MANYHPADELLMTFAAGQQHGALGVMLACHLEQCARCRQRVKLYEDIGGELLEQIEPLAVSETLLSAVLDKLNQPSPQANRLSVPTGIPRPLHRFVRANYAQLKWSGMTPGIKELTLPIKDPGFTAKLYKIAAGKELPIHTHRGNEYTLVMDGSFSDAAGDYHPGDFILADTQTTHQPRASRQCDCICFAVLDAPLRMTGFFGRMLNPFLR